MKYLAYILPYWKLVIAIVVIVLVLVIWRPFKKKGFQGTSDIPGNPKGTADALTDDEVRSINDLTKRLIEDIEGYSLGSRDNDAYLTASKASDRILVGIYNLYRKETGNSLIAAIEGEYYFVAWNYSGDKNEHPYYTSQTIIDRLKNLELS